MTDRDSDGRFLAGTSGNPGGRPRMRPEVRSAAQDGAVEAVARLRKIIADDGAPAAAVVLACREVLDRAYGRSVPEAPALPDRPVPVLDRVEFRIRLDAMFAARCEQIEVPQPPPEVSRWRYRMPDGRELDERAFYGEQIAWVASILDVLCPEPAAPRRVGGALTEQRPDEDRFDLSLPE